MSTAPDFNRYDAGNVAVPREDVATFMGRVYGWMGFGLFLTGLFAYAVFASEAAQQLIFGTPLRWLLLVAQLGMVFIFGAALKRVSYGTAAAMYASYCVLSGLTFSVYFMVYTMESIASTFFITGGMFAGMSVFGTVTKRDLTSWGSFLFMALWGLILCGLVNMFLHSSTLGIVTSAIAVLVFTGLTAYDTQKIRRWAALGDQRLAIAGALELYLDFINLFISILRLFGRRR